MLAIIMLSLGFAAAAQAEIGDSYRDEFVFGRGKQTLPLPAGDWVLVAQRDTNDEFGNRFDSVILVQISDGRLAGSIKAFASVSDGLRGNVKSRFCGSTVNLVNEERSRTSEISQDCRGITVVEFKRERNSSKLAKGMYAYLEERDIVYEGSQVLVGYAKNSAQASFVTYYTFSPQIDGISNASRSEWNPDRIKDDPAREAFIRKLEQWGSDWQSKIDNVFNF